MKNILIFCGSPRKGGNSDLLCEQFMAGAQEAGHKVEKIFVQEHKIAPCRTGAGLVHIAGPSLWQSYHYTERADSLLIS